MAYRPIGAIMALDFFGGIGNMLGSFLHPERGYNEAEKAFTDYLNQARSTEQPFINQGMSQFPILQGAESNLLDPSKLLADWMSKYEMSPYAKTSLANAREQGLNAAQAQGLGGSSAATANIEQSASDIMNKDRSQFLEDLMRKYLAGIGIGENIFGTGASMAGNLGQQLIGGGQTIGGLRYGEQNAPGQSLAHLLNLGTQLFTGGGFGGGTPTGGYNPSSNYNFGSRPGFETGIAV